MDEMSIRLDGWWNEFRGSFIYYIWFPYFADTIERGDRGEREDDFPYNFNMIFF